MPFTRSCTLTAVLAAAVSCLQTSAAMAQQQTLFFDLPAGSLASTLNGIARQGNQVISLDPALVAGKQAPAIEGEMTTTQALERALAGSGLELRMTETGGFSVQPIALGDTMSLDVMRVEDNALGTITEQTKSYTPGTIASATRLVLTPRETPQTVTVVTRQHMDDFNLTDIDKVIEHTPGVTLQRMSNFRSLYYARGYPIRNFQYDGVPTFDDSVNSMGQTSSDMIQYDRVEIIKGASGLTTGAGGPGATLNLVRKKPTHEFSGHATAEAGRWDNYRTEWDVGGPLNESGSVRGRIATAFQDRQSFQDHAKEQTRALYGILEVDLTPQMMWTIGGNYDKRIPNGDMWGGIRLFDSNNKEVDVSRSFNPGATWAYNEEFSHAFFTQLDHSFDNGWSSRLYYTFQKNAYIGKLGSLSATPNADNGNTTLQTGYYRYKTRTQALEGYARGPFELFGRTHELVFGFSGYHNHHKGKGRSYLQLPVDNYWEWEGHIQRPDWGAIRSRTEDRINQRAYYASTRLSLTDDLAVILGGRVTNYLRGGDSNMHESGEVVPFAGITYDLNDNFSVYASYTKIFMPQSARDANNSVLDPDEGDSYEVGFKGEWFNGRLNASLAYFEIRQDNRAESTGIRDPELNYLIYRGVKAKSKGIELEITGELMPDWNIQAGFTHQVIREDATNEKLTTYQPENQFKIYTTYRLPGILNKLTIGGGANYQGTTWSDGTDAFGGTRQYRQEAFWLLNAMGKYQVSDSVSATLNINNLLDKYYYSNYGYGNGKMYGEPRNMMLTTRWDF
ncbi:outer membrane ferripyoverdine receptor [Azotobacter vinelandii CA]|uniref:Outer membrane ferripyoverdine receptor n=2 Tax=Azotobacter vinelandii TaxID=354 RepID=C1DH77_AZOVD|nr:TonB-dependent siderophore receptor [Azotobacter vinelandii]ACO76484.1 outer membrane ferripyoverdine receptor [Azotobacter vinelandii DJ]AGK17384.1 outer membrane ferripyoverdine receptor [Azotobacter vinelandii CA]AGK19155.1 outer membrane ferripyoverdine receptor [Azotobacter vinelandii CA6]SFX09033.1 outer-membrane receptor for ferric coprogen and ferric-rhodotorulic acid [Azotobacter vinelandii]GLK58670.1 ferripyoverdine receptor [Azotobacter vinelandii]